MRSILLAIVVTALLVTLTGCGGPSGVTQTGQTEHYTIQLNLDGTGFGERTATIVVNDAAGQPVAADEVVIAPVMREMGMAAPEAIAQPLAPGRYQAKGEFFVMTGAWELDVRVSVGGAEEVTSFKVDVIQP